MNRNTITCITNKHSRKPKDIYKCTVLRHRQYRAQDTVRRQTKKQINKQIIKQKQKNPTNNTIQQTKKMTTKITG